MLPTERDTTKSFSSRVDAWTGRENWSGPAPSVGFCASFAKSGVTNHFALIFYLFIYLCKYIYIYIFM